MLFEILILVWIFLLCVSKDLYLRGVYILRIRGKRLNSGVGVYYFMEIVLKWVLEISFFRLIFYKYCYLILGKWCYFFNI